MKSGTRAVVAAAAVIAALGLVTGCGSDTGDKKGKSGGSGDGKGETAAAAKPLTASALQRAALVKSDVKGFAIEKMTDKEFAEGGQAKAAKAECQPLASLMGAKFDPAPQASVYRTYATSDGTDLGLSGMIRVSSYGAGDAERTVKDLRSAVTACQGGFAATSASGTKENIAKVTPQDAPKLGDEAVSYSMFDGGKDKAVVKFAVVRSGAHLTVFFGVNIADPTKSEIPPALLKAQVAKVEKAVEKSATS